MDPVVIEQLGIAHPLARHVGDFLADLANANASAHTLRAYRGDLLQFCAHHDGETSELTAVPVRAYLAEIAELAPSTRKRKRAAVASFCRWAVRHDLLDANPMDKIDTIKVPKTLPRPAATADVAKVLARICSRRPRKDVPLDRLRDRVLFETAYVCGARAAVLRRRPPPVGGLLHRGRARHRHPPAAPRPRHRTDQLRGVHRSRPPPPRPRQQRNHPALRPAGGQ